MTESLLQRPIETAGHQHLSTCTTRRRSDVSAPSMQNDTPCLFFGCGSIEGSLIELQGSLLSSASLASLRSRAASVRRSLTAAAKAYNNEPYNEH